MKIFRNTLLIALALMIMISCNSKSGKDEVLAPGTKKIEVEEVLQTGNYTYLRGMSGDQEIWMAISKQEVQKGKAYYYVEDLKMDNFTSKELKRTFESIYFVQVFSDQPIAMSNGKPAVSPGSQKAAPDQVTVKIEPIEGGTTIAQLLEKRNGFSGKTIKVSGQVVKVNTQIMGSNWLHIQDGTSFGGEYDLTVTTQDEAAVGDFVIAEGAITLNKDFGAGYSYAVIMEKAKVTKK